MSSLELFYASLHILLQHVKFYAGLLMFLQDRAHGVTDRR